MKHPNQPRLSSSVVGTLDEVNNMKRIAAIVAGLLMFASLGFAQSRPTPFGFHAGWSREQVVNAIGKSHIKKEQGPAMIFDATPAGVTNGFDDFVIIISSKGLAKVMATVAVPTNRSGEQVRDKYDGIRAALISKYSKPSNDWDFVHANALFSEPEDFTMSLVKGERTLTCDWALADGTLISLEVSGSSSQQADIYLKYEFHPEFDAFSADQEKQEKAAY